jgi:hypothetical protein
MSRSNASPEGVALVAPARGVVPSRADSVRASARDLSSFSFGFKGPAAFGLGLTLRGFSGFTSAIAARNKSTSLAIRLI